MSRFDGRSWISSRLSAFGGTDINPSVLETRDGTLWVGGGGGNPLHAFRDGKWTVYRRPDTPLPDVRIWDLIEASDGGRSGWSAGATRHTGWTVARATQWTSYEGLIAQCETPDGAQWFTSQKGEVIRYDGQTWTRYGGEDGGLDFVWRLIVARDGTLWAAGSHGIPGGQPTNAFAEFQEATAATARFDGHRWSLKTHPRLDWMVHPQAVFESRDGDLWFGASSNQNPERGHRGRILRFDGKAWTHYTPPDASSSSYGIGQTAGGTLWSGGVRGLDRFDGQRWARIQEPAELAASVSDAVYSTLGGDLWIGTRTYGVFHFDGKAWTRYDVRHGLAGNHIRSVLQTDDGSVWVLTSEGISRFDGQTWVPHALPHSLVGEAAWFYSLKQSRDGAIWINRTSFKEGRFFFSTTRYRPDAASPETQITLSLEEVSQPGNTTLAWTGTDPWRDTPSEELQYAWRLDGGPWSAFSKEIHKTFLALSSGDRTFEVKARDRDFNEDPTSALLKFTVIPPVWQQPWFLGLMAILLGGIGFQTTRVIRRDRRLQESNSALSDANKELFGLNKDLNQSNQELTVEAALERVRAKALGMQKSDELSEVSETLFEQFEGLGMDVFRSGLVLGAGGYDYFKNIGIIERTFSRLNAPPFPGLSQARDEAKQNGAAHFLYEREGQDLVNQIRNLFERFDKSKVDEILEALPQKLQHHNVFLERGWLTICTEIRLTDADLAVAKRFAEMFDLAYTRYLELQEKEDRNRELEETNQELIVEAALERVRGKAQGMQESKALWEVSKALSEEFKRLEIPHYLSAITILDEERDAVEWWPISDILADRYQAEMKMAMDGGLPFLRGSFKAFKEIKEIDPMLIESLKARERGEIFYVSEESREEGPLCLY